MEYRTGTPIGKLDLKDATTHVLEENGILSAGDILKHLNSKRLTKLSRIGPSREGEILCALRAAGFDISSVTGAAAGVEGAAAAPPGPGG